MLIKIEPTATGKNGRIFFAIEINKPKSRKKNAITLPENAVAGAFFPEMNQVGKKTISPTTKEIATGQNPSWKFRPPVFFDHKISIGKIAMQRTEMNAAAKWNFLDSINFGNVSGGACCSKISSISSDNSTCFFSFILPFHHARSESSVSAHIPFLVFIVIISRYLRKIHLFLIME